MELHGSIHFPAEAKTEALRGWSGPPFRLRVLRTLTLANRKLRPECVQDSRCTLNVFRIRESFVLRRLQQKSRPPSAARTSAGVRRSSGWAWAVAAALIACHRLKKLIGTRASAEASSGRSAQRC